MRHEERKSKHFFYYKSNTNVMRQVLISLPQGVDIAEFGARSGKLNFRRLDPDGANKFRTVITHLHFRNAAMVLPVKIKYIEP